MKLLTKVAKLPRYVRHVVLYDGTLSPAMARRHLRLLKAQKEGKQIQVLDAVKRGNDWEEKWVDYTIKQNDWHLTLRVKKKAKVKK